MGQAATVSFSVPEGSLGFWLGRLSARNLKFERAERFGDAVLAFEDPDGLSLELVAHAGASTLAAWAGGPVEAEHAVRSFHSVALWEDGSDETAALLTGRLGYRKLGEEDNVERFVHGGGGPGALIDLRRADGFWPSVMGAGTVHHVAFRAEDDVAQQTLRADLLTDFLQPTSPIDRQYFRSVYFREPGGVLFEVATDPPGFTVDETLEALGQALKLPPQYEGIRSELEATLPPLHLPTETGRPNFGETDLGFVHRWLPREDAPRTLFMLHGTGGDENSLVSLGKMLEPDASILSPRGKVLENGMSRFFRRLSEGVFDEADLKHRAGELTEFVHRAAETYSLKMHSIVAVGYSNGANIASATLLLHPQVLSGAALFRPMAPFEPDRLPDLSGLPVFLSAGKRDPIVPTENVERLAVILEKAGAVVTLHWEDTGHGLTDNELRAVRRWLTDKEHVK